MKKVKQFQIIEITRSKHPDGEWSEVYHKGYTFCQSRQEAERTLNWLIDLYKDSHVLEPLGDGHIGILNKKKNKLTVYTIAPIEHINITEVEL